MDDIKVSRGEENIFIWCFFLAIVQLVRRSRGLQVGEYIYIDDPISSLDEHNAITVGESTSAQLLMRPKTRRQDGYLVAPRSVLQRPVQRVARNEGQRVYFLYNDQSGSTATCLRDTGNTPFFHHVATLGDLDAGADDRQALHASTSTCCAASWRRPPAFSAIAIWRHACDRRRDDADRTLYKR